MSFKHSWQTPYGTRNVSPILPHTCYVTISLLRAWAVGWLIKAPNRVLSQLCDSMETIVQKYGLICVCNSTNFTWNQVMCIKFEEVHTRSKLNIVEHCCEV